MKELFRKILEAILALLQSKTTPAPTNETKPAEPLVTPEPTKEPLVTPDTGDAIDLQAWSVGVKNCPGVTEAKVKAAKVTAKLTAAWTNGEKLFVSYEPYSWPAQGEEKRIDAIAMFGYGNRIEKFDYWRAGGQTDKTLENIVNGPYDTLTMPARGAYCYTMIVSLDGSQRSNVVAVGWK